MTTWQLETQMQPTYSNQAILITFWIEIKTRIKIEMNQYLIWHYFTNLYFCNPIKAILPWKANLVWNSLTVYYFNLDYNKTVVKGGGAGGGVNVNLMTVFSTIPKRDNIEQMRYDDWANVTAGRLWLEHLLNIHIHKNKGCMSYPQSCL